MRLKPGPLVAVIAFAPAHLPPIQAAMLAISSSIWRNEPFALGSSLLMYSVISLAGVMGYPAKRRHPARSAPSAQAMLPNTRCLPGLSNGCHFLDFYCEVWAIALAPSTSGTFISPLRKGSP